MSYQVHLRQFEGPLGLLLYLIRKEEMDIFDIHVGEITRQYLEYIRLMKEFDLDVAGEFITMAATLIHIKSRMLLPQYNDEGEVLDQEDPRRELVQKLLEYQKYQDAAKRLYERPLLGRDIFPRGLRENFHENELGEILIEGDGLFSLISAFRRAVKKAHRLVHQVRPKVQSIANRVMEMKDRLIVGARILLSQLIDAEPAQHRNQLLVTFLSILELGRMGYVSLFQSEVYGDIHIETKKPIERNVLERVQEFETLDSEAVAQSLFAKAESAKIESAILESADPVVTTDSQTAPLTEALIPQQIAFALSDLEIQLAAESGSEVGLQASGIEADEFIEIASDADILAAEADFLSLEAVPQAMQGDAIGVLDEVVILEEVVTLEDVELKSSEPLLDLEPVSESITEPTFEMATDLATEITNAEGDFSLNETSRDWHGFTDQQALIESESKDEPESKDVPEPILPKPEPLI